MVKRRIHEALTIDGLMDLHYSTHTLRAWSLDCHCILKKERGLCLELD